MDRKASGIVGKLAQGKFDEEKVATPLQGARWGLGWPDPTNGRFLKLGG